MLALTSRRFEFLRQRFSDLAPDLRVLASKAMDNEDAVAERFKAVFTERVSSQRTRFHGRSHLGHVLVSNGDFVFFDFEGDPENTLSERRIKRCPLRDVASMVHSFGYAGRAATIRLASSERNERSSRQAFRSWGRFWFSHVTAAFVRGYWQAAKGAAYLPTTLADQQLLLDTNILERALIDVRTNLNERPEFVEVPLRVILHLLNLTEIERPSNA